MIGRAAARIAGATVHLSKRTVTEGDETIIEANEMAMVAVQTTIACNGKTIMHVSIPAESTPTLIVDVTPNSVLAAPFPDGGHWAIVQSPYRA